MAHDYESPRKVPTSAIIPFMAIAFGLAWGLFVVLFLFPEAVARLFGGISASNPLFILAVYAPAIAALILVLWYTGLSGMKGFLSRLLLWRCSFGWAAFLLLAIPAIYYSGALVKGTALAVSFPSIGAAFAAMAFMLLLGPMEEFGWRGFALPLLQRRMAPIWAGLLLGLIWGAWHLPAFFLSGTPQSAWGISPFIIGSISVSVILTPLFNASGGSILLSALFHFQLNNPLWPDAQPYDTIFFVSAAALVVWFNRDTMFDRRAGQTRITVKRLET
ncbi:CPBP family intramembrane glutamic endopeptidase [Litoreibacter halocynthiae]|uniref:CPBP family intramembrane glutamic endopeptidase n=1 Tax=Litoreibacter halocynthiae TaxID=1242689 RepID=UPI00248FC25E|nr:CPBP family intramembrane glutamic endopeptidase [Litoreibacter halocynthiae]